jgi:Ulp1 family protease
LSPYFHATIASINTPLFIDWHQYQPFFYSTLVNEDIVSAVASWTRSDRRAMDIFQKKFIIIPINKDYHWTLAVIVNQGVIGRPHLLQSGVLEESKLEGELPWRVIFDYCSICY